MSSIEFWHKACIRLENMEQSQRLTFGAEGSEPKRRSLKVQLDGTKECLVRAQAQYAELRWQKIMQKHEDECSARE